MPIDVEKLQQRLESAEKLIGTLIPAVSAGSAMVRLIVKTIRPKLSPDRQQEFDAAIANTKTAHAQLGEDLAEYQRVRNALFGDAPQPSSTPGDVSGMTSANSGGLSKEQ